MSKDRVIVLGSNGQLGSCLRDCAEGSGVPFEFLYREDADLAEASDIEDLFARLEGQFSLCINCAAVVNTKGIESDPEIARQSELVNHQAPALLAKGVAAAGAALIHVSTDYVFGDESVDRPRTEDEECRPLNLYGRHKRDAELAIGESGARAAVIRTSYLYSEYGSNLVKSILGLAADRDSINVVNDIVCSPTYAHDLAEAILAISRSPRLMRQEGAELYQYSGEGAVRLCDFASEIVSRASLPARINPISSEEYGDGIGRPHYSVLSTQRLREHYGVEVHPWQDSLRRCLEVLGPVGPAVPP